MQTINKNIDINYLVQEAKENLDKYGFYIAKKIINKEKYLEARNNSILHFDNLEKEYRKLSYPLRGYVSAGMRDVSGLSNNEAWYLFRSCFFPWNRPNYNLRGLINISREISSIRNAIKGIPDDYGRYVEDDNFTAYTSLSNYPKDGGFLRKHKDGKESNILHFKVELTHKGEDYKKGGFYVYDKVENSKIDISSVVKPCDVVFFDGSQSHGIDPIYGDKGRVAFFEIPTYVNHSSRYAIYTNDGWSLFKRSFFKAQLYLEPKIKAGISKFINFLP